MLIETLLLLYCTILLAAIKGMLFADFYFLLLNLDRE